MRKVLPSFQVSSNVPSSNPLLWLLHPSPIFQSPFHSYCRHPIAPYLNLYKDLNATAQKGTLPPLPQNGLSFTLPKSTVHHHTTFPFLPILPAFHLPPFNHPSHSPEPENGKAYDGHERTCRLQRRRRCATGSCSRSGNGGHFCQVGCTSFSLTFPEVTMWAWERLDSRTSS